MIFEVVFTKKANETFDAIRTQILDRWNEKVEAEFEKRTLKVIDIISQYPACIPINKNRSIYQKSFYT